MARKILVLTTEPLPLPGLPATGAGLRAWSLGFGLRSAGVGDVVLGFAADSVRDRELPRHGIPGVETFERGDLDAYIRRHNPDAVVLQHWGLFGELKQPLPCPLAMDLAGPHLLERRLWGSADPAEDLRQKLTALAAADHVVCSGAYQRHYFLPFLIQAGHDPRTSLCPVIPFSLSPDLPEPAPDRDFSTFIFAGMFLPWQDPEAVLRAVVETMEERGKGRLLFVGGPHPSGDVSGGRFDSLQEYLAGHPAVETHPVMPFEDLLRLLRGAGAAIDLMPRNAERELAFPTRTVTYLWAGLPVIHNDYDELAEPIQRGKAGWVLDPLDDKALRRTLGRLIGHKEDVERRSESARDLVRKQFTWDRTIEPLAGWCRSPEYREAKAAVPVTVSIQNSRATGPSTPQGQPRRRRRDTIQYAPRAPHGTGGPWYLSPVVFLLALPVSAVLLLLFGLAEIVRMIVRPDR